MPLRFSRHVAALLFIVLVPCVRAQTGAPLRLQVTCQNTFCDQDYFRTQLTFAEFVRDVNDATVQVLITSQSNGAGGNTYELRFIGQGGLAGRNDELTVATKADDTQDDVRKAIVKALSAGLLPYAARVGSLDRFTIGYTAPASSAVAAPARDPWNRWVYSLSGRSNFNGDKNYRSLNLGYNANANRVTEQWKTSVSLFQNSNADTYVLNDSTEDKVTRSSLGANAEAVYSLGDRWSASLEGSASRSNFSNTDLSLRLEPGVEFDFFPYSESTKRIVTLRYEVGLERLWYRDTTLYRKLEETLARHSLTLGSNFQQPWGTFYIQTSADQFLNHPSQYSISTFSNANVRLFKGFSFNFYVGVDLLRNQRNISAEGVSTDDIYTRRRALATGYNYFGGAGLRYTFGSALTGAVNPRFSSGGSFFF